MTIKRLIFLLTLFAILLLCSAFFSSAETSFLTINRSKLAHRAKKKNKKAQLLNGILEKPEEFFSTILVGNNLVNVSLATLATYLITQLFPGQQNLILIAESLVTTLLILILGEITPKSYAYRHAEQLADLYAYPINFINRLFYPLVKILSLLSNLLLHRRRGHIPISKQLSIEEIKHFLSQETQLFQSDPETLKMINEILDVARKDIRAIMTPRPGIIALPDDARVSELTARIGQKYFSKVPIYKGNLDHISGIIHSHSLFQALAQPNPQNLSLRDIAAKPIFISEYSSLNFILREFKKHQLNIAVVVDEYGTTLGIITLSDILREMLGDIGSSGRSIKKVKNNVSLIKGSTPVEEINSQLELELPEKKDYSTLSGLFIFHYGKFPGEGTRLHIGPVLLIVKKMGKRKIDELLLVTHEDHHR